MTRDDEPRIERIAERELQRHVPGLDEGLRAVLVSLAMEAKADPDRLAQLLAKQAANEALDGQARALLLDLAESMALLAWARMPRPPSSH